MKTKSFIIVLSIMIIFEVIFSWNTRAYDLNNDEYKDIVISNEYNSNTFHLNSWGDLSASYSTKTEWPTQGAFGNSVPTKK